MIMIAISTRLLCRRLAMLTATGALCALYAEGLRAQARSAAPGSVSTGAATPFATLDRSGATAGPLAVMVSVDARSRARGEVLADIARQAHVSFVADRALPALQQRVTLTMPRVSAGEALMRATDGAPLTVLVGPGGQIVIKDRPAVAPVKPDAEGQERLRMTGYIRNAATQEVVRHAFVAADDDVRRESNEEGFYFLTLTAGVHRIRVRALGFAPFDTTLTLRDNITVDLQLGAANVTLSAVKVQANKGERADLDPQLPDMSVVRLDLKTAKNAPVMLGEPDAIRTLMLLPGVSAASDASTSFNVRGGGADQNLILLDESTIYNPAHILGFLSVFNSDAIDDVTLYKGAIPARFGGRLSSVVDIRQREGNAKQFVGNASIGLLSSRASYEGPLPGNRGAFMVAARRSYADLFLGLATDSTLKESVAYFYDVNAKASLRLGKSGALLLSGYGGRDRFAQGREVSTGWGNRAATLRWNQAIAGRLFSKVTSAWSDYDYRLTFPVVTRDTVSWVAGIRSLDVKVDEVLNLTDRNRLEFGAELIGQEFRPGEIGPTGRSTVKRDSIETRHGLSSAYYLGQELDLGDRVSVRYGLRYASFARVGAATIYRYANNAPVTYNRVLGRYEPSKPIDSTRYAEGKTVSSDDGFEPRFSARFSLSPQTSLKASYARTRQYLQLASRTNSPTPLDVWEPVGPYIQPQQSDQYAIGLSSARTGWELSAEAYYKHSDNVIDFIDGADIIFNKKLETQLVQGDGRAYGLELFARRQRGRLTGWLSYTLSRAEQRVVAPIASTNGAREGINGGRFYASPFDKTHNLSAVGVYTLSPKWTVGATFSLASGLPATFPVSRYVVDGLLVAEFGERNANRLPVYHRLDLSATRKLGRGELQFGVLNAYNRFNAQSIRFRQAERDARVGEAVQLSVFGIVPSISYQFRFSGKPQ